MRYLVIRRIGGRINYYLGGGLWTSQLALGRRYDGYRASSICEGLQCDGIDATFIAETRQSVAA